MLLTEYNETEVMNLFREEGKIEGLREGKIEGEAKINSLYVELVQSGRMDDLHKAISDPHYLQKLKQEFGLSEDTE